MKGEELITRGLVSEFQGKANTYGEEVDEDGNEIKFARLTTSEFDYHDRYYNKRISRGKDYAIFGKFKISREYWGQTEDESVLKPLGITEADVFAFLIEVITTSGQATRLAKDFMTEKDDWKYEYIVDFKNEDETKVLGTERIFYKGVQVFIHNFDIEVTEVM